MKPIPDREQIPKMYLEDGLSCRQIAAIVGLTRGAVHSILVVRRVPLRKSKVGKKRLYEQRQIERQAKAQKLFEDGQAIRVAKMREFEEAEAVRHAALPQVELDREQVRSAYIDAGGSTRASFGMLGRQQSEHQKQRAAEAARGNQRGVGHTVTSEHRAILAAARRSRPGTNTGRKFTQEHKDKIRASNLGRKHTEETVDKIKAARAEQVLPVEDTLPERMLQNALDERGLVYEKHKKIYGLPDLFLVPNVCVFVDGDYWHRRPDTREKDASVNAALAARGYKIIRVWEAEVKANVNACVDRIVALIEGA